MTNHLNLPKQQSMAQMNGCSRLCRTEQNTYFRCVERSISECRRVGNCGGTGQHCVHFAAQRPDWSWQPSEIDPERIKSINAYQDTSQLPNLRSAITVDISRSDWSETAGQRRDIFVQPAASGA